VRSVFFQLHKWLGIVLAIWVILIGLSGAVLIFRPELQKISYPQFFSVARSGIRDASADTLLDALRTAYPRARLSGLDWPTYRRDTVLAYVLDGSAFRTVFLHPQTAAILGEMPEHWWITTLQEFHFNLLSGRTGRTVNGIAALCLVGTLGAGLVAWWPAIGRWKQSLTIDFSRSWKRMNWQAHNAVGFWLFALLLLWAVTGVEFAFPKEFKAVVHAVSPLTTLPTPTSELPATTPLSSRSEVTRAPQRPTADELVAQARALVPGAIVARLVLPTTPKAAALVLMARKIHGDFDTSDEVQLYFDQYTGSLIERHERRDVRRTAGDALMATIGPLHLGTFGGVGAAGAGVKVSWALFALGFPLLAMSGLVMWWKK
jgi:uncharacterized iron-regulated membrane protein